MSCCIEKIQNLIPIYQPHFKEAINCYKKHSSNQEILEACKEFFTKHLISLHEKESKSPAKVILAPGRLMKEEYFDKNVKSLKKLGLDVIKMIATSQHPQKDAVILRLS